MYYANGSWLPKHKVFVSYYHHDDQWYRDAFEQRYSHLFISKSVQPGDINPDLSAEYIKRLIQEGYITDSSIVLVLVGPNTRCRKHVDWEISGGLDARLRGYSGLIGLLLPEFPMSQNQYSVNDLPARLADNVRSDYALIDTWYHACASDSAILSLIEQAFNQRITHKDRINNSRPQMQYNLCGS